MVYAAILRSPHAHAHIRAIDTVAARHTPGVVAVITADDLTEVAEPLPTRRETEAQELRPPIHPLLARGKVCYTGQPVAVVVAQERYRVHDALAAIQVDYAPLPAVVDPLEAMQAEAVHQELGTNIALRLLNTGGDLEATFAQAEHIVRQRYRVQRLAPVPLETRGVVAHYQPQDDVLHVWDSTQHPHEVRDQIAALLHRPEHRVRVVAPDVGGGFGEKGDRKS